MKDEIKKMKDCLKQYCAEQDCFCSNCELKNFLLGAGCYYPNKACHFDDNEDVLKKVYSMIPKRFSETNIKEEVNHPKRYSNGKYECIEVMKDVFGNEFVKNFCIGNSFKYIWRNEHKNGVEDIKKAVFYLNYYIDMEEKKR